MGRPNGLRYPDDSIARIPAENFDVDDAETALYLAAHIVDVCRTIVYENKPTR